MKSKFVLLALVCSLTLNVVILAQSDTRVPVEGAAPVIQPATPSYEASPIVQGPMESSMAPAVAAPTGDCGACGSPMPAYSGECSDCSGAYGYPAMSYSYDSDCGCGYSYGWSSGGWGSCGGYGCGGYDCGSCYDGCGYSSGYGGYWGRGWRPMWYGRRFGCCGCGF
jgi:hypothetical protein